MPEEEERAAGREIVRYDAKVIAVHWVVMLVFIPLALVSLLLLRDWFYAEFNILGGDRFIATFEGARDVHVALAVMLLVIGLVHVLLHAGQRDKPMLPKDLGEDFRSTVNSLRYVLLLSNWDEKGAAHKYKGNQRITYLATFYTVALAGVTGALVALDLMGEVAVVLHVVCGVLVLLLSLFRIAYLLRKREWNAWRSILRTGKMPEWFVKLHHARWYEELMARASEGDERPGDGTSGPGGLADSTGPDAPRAKAGPTESKSAENALPAPKVSS